MTPKLTIGVPVLNGGRTLSRALDSLLSQSWGDFELRLSDNGSSDETGDICRAFARQDRRLKYVRRSETVPALQNFSGLLDNIKSPYFMFAAADDFWEPRFIEKNLENLDLRDDAVMSCSRVAFLGEGGSWISRATYPLTADVQTNLRRYLSNPGDNSRFYGIYRSSTMQAAFKNVSSMVASDWLIVALSLLHGSHLEVPEVLMTRSETPPGAYVNWVNRLESGTLGRAIPVQRMARHLLRRLPPELRLKLMPTLLAMCLRSTLNSPYTVMRKIGEGAITIKKFVRPGSVA